MSEKIEFKLEKVEALPSRKYRKGSKWDAPLNSFIMGTSPLQMLEVVGKEANYLRTQLQKRILSQGIKTVKVSVVNGGCYLEKLDPTESKPEKRRRSPKPKPTPEDNPTTPLA